jgi:NTE family protein
VAVDTAVGASATNHIGANANVAEATTPSGISWQAFVRKSLAATIGHGIPHLRPDQRKLLDATKELRHMVQGIRDTEAKLVPGLDVDARTKIEESLAFQRDELEREYGYKVTPSPNQLFIDPAFIDPDDLPASLVFASHFPNDRAPLAAPKKPEDFLFTDASGKPRKLTCIDGTGKDVTFDDAAAYKAFVAENRAAAGMPKIDGELIPVHLVLEGGGGLGKRYVAAFLEMMRLGVVPVSAAGASAGSLVGLLVAGGADPKQLKNISNSPAFKKFYDFAVGLSSGLMRGKAAYDFFDAALRELTGIHDRPVLFADLPAPLQVVATIASDSQPEQSEGDMSTISERTLVFSQETTPYVPVALAARASMAIPAFFADVSLIDPISTRVLNLVDGGRSATFRSALSAAIFLRSA